jgi:hypothetical protein
MINSVVLHLLKKLTKTLSFLPEEIAGVRVNSSLRNITRLMFDIEELILSVQNYNSLFFLL